MLFYDTMRFQDVGGIFATEVTIINLADLEKW